MMRSVGVITIYDSYNYGNRLQNYATNMVLKKLKCKADTIVKTKILGHGGLSRFSLYMFLWGNRRNVYMRLSKFSRFNSHIKYKIYSKKEYDFYLCGSDQIWNPNFAGDDFYFAAFAPENKRIAYAASVGVDRIPQIEKERYAKRLNEMKAISVREQAGADIVMDLTGRKAEVLIDPTMMLDKCEWQKIKIKPCFIKKKKFILTYFLGEVTDIVNEYIENLHNNYDLEPIRLEKKNPNKYWYSTGPSEFLWLIDNCELMLTDSFHGSVFSVLMDVPFIVFDRSNENGRMSSRIDTLLSTLKLKDRMFNNQTGKEIFKHDYGHVNDILNQEREKAINFLKNSMELK